MRFGFQRNKSIGMLLLAIWLILIGLQAFIPMGSFSPITSVLAIAAGVLILLGK